MKTMSSYDPIDEALNTHTEVEAIVPSKKEVKLENKEKKSEDIEKDYEYTRANLYSLIENASNNGFYEDSSDLQVVF